MRGEDKRQSGMFSYVTLEQRIPADHPARKIRTLADQALLHMDRELGELYAATGRPSIAPERLLRALLLQVLYSVRSERQLMEQLDYNLLFRWFVGLEMDDAVWDVTVFTKNRERLISGEASQQLLRAVLDQAREQQLLSEEHFTVDGTLIQAWAAARSFTPRDNPPGPGQGSGRDGEVLLRDKVESRTDPEARLYRKSKVDRSLPSYLGHALMENRSGLIVAAEVSLAAADAEAEAAVTMLDRTLSGEHQRRPGRITLGADTGYQQERLLRALRERHIAPHVSEYVKGNLPKNGLSGEERADQRRLTSQRKRKLIEKVFAWAKASGLRQVKMRGLKRVDWFYRLTIAAYNLVRLRRLLPAVPAQAG